MTFHIQGVEFAVPLTEDPDTNRLSRLSRIQNPEAQTRHRIPLAGTNVFVPYISYLYPLISLVAC